MSRNSSMRIVVAYPGTGVFAEQVALAFHEVGSLERFETTFAWQPEGRLARCLAGLPGSLPVRLSKQFARRSLLELPFSAVRTRPLWEMTRVGAQLVGLPETIVDRIWDRGSRCFTRNVARRLHRGVGSLYAYEYTALEAFIVARELGIRTVLDFPSLDGRETERILRVEREKYPDLVTPQLKYFRKVFEKRQKRREQERELAELIITNSSLTRASHVQAGTPPERVVAIPLGAPPALDEPPPKVGRGSLRVVWAGTFGVHKGAHYLLEALKLLGPSGAHVCVDVYGSVALPERYCLKAPPGVVFHGSVSKKDLYAAFDVADALVLPTLSDGFGMVITEAFARGLPVITTPRAGAADFVEHERNGLLVAAANARSLADALAWALDNRLRLRAMGQSALKTAKGWQWKDYRTALRAAIEGRVFETPSSRVGTQRVFGVRMGDGAV